MTLINMAEDIRLAVAGNEGASDQIIPGAIIGTITVEHGEIDQFPEQEVRFDEVMGQLRQLEEAGHQLAGVVARDFEQHVSPEQFSMPGATVRRLLWGIVVYPEGYGETWGWVQASETTLDWNAAVGEFIDRRSPEIAERLLRGDMIVGKLNEFLRIQMRLEETHPDRIVGEKQLQSLVKMNFLALLETFDQDLLIQDFFNLVQEGEGHVYTFGDGHQIPKGFIVGNTGGLVTAWVRIQIDGEVGRVRRELTEAFFTNGYNPHLGSEALVAGSRVVMTIDDVEAFRSQVPSPEERTRGHRLILLADAELIPRIMTKMFEQEGRYLGEMHIGREFFEQFRRSSYPRYLPRNGNVPSRALTAEEIAMSTADPNDYVAIPSEIFDLFYHPTNRDLEELNRRIDHCLRTGEPLVLYIPTCPCDQHAYIEDDRAVSFIGGPILPGISWPAMNTLDAMQPLVDRLNALGVDVEVVFATGDIEHPSGQTRGMTAQEYFAVLDENHQSIATHAACRLGVEQGSIYIENGQDGYHIRQMQRQNGKSTIVRVEGIMQIAGGEYAWLERRRQVEPIVDDYFGNPVNQTEMDRVIAARANIYRQRVAAARQLSPDVIPPLSREELLAELRIDIIDYCAFHRLAIDTYGNQRVIVLAGDSRPLESLAARIMGTHLLAVHGNYDGSRFTDE